MMSALQKDIIRQNYPHLNDELVIDEEFLNLFVPSRVLTDENINKILANSTRREKARAFWEIIKRRGAQAYDVTYDALIKTFQHALADILKPEFAPSAQRYPAGQRRMGGGSPGSGGGNSDRPQRQLVQPEEPDAPNSTSIEPVSETTDDADSLVDDAEYLDHNNETLFDMSRSLHLRPTTKEKIKRKFSSQDVYPMTPVRGRVLIINMEKFNGNGFNDRHGSSMDVYNLCYMFKSLGFENAELEDVKVDLTREALLNEIRFETQKPSHKDYGMFALVIMTHGSRGILYAVDGSEVDIADDIIDLLSAKNFPSMSGKPKLVILQACAGRRKDNLVEDHARPIAPRADGDKPAVKKERSTPNIHDILIIQASFDGYVSKRHEVMGTWFIRAVIEAIMKHGCHRDVLSLVRVVRNFVTKHGNANGGLFQSVTARDVLSKKLYLFPGYNP